MPDNIIVLLDTTVADAGPTQTTGYSHLRRDIPSRISASIATGDTVVIEGKAEAADSFEALHTFTTNTPADVFLSRIWRLRRTVDGAAGDSTIKIENRFNLNLTEHI